MKGIRVRYKNADQFRFISIHQLHIHTALARQGDRETEPQFSTIFKEKKLGGGEETSSKILCHSIPLLFITRFGRVFYCTPIALK